MSSKRSRAERIRREVEDWQRGVRRAEVERFLFETYHGPLIGYFRSHGVPEGEVEDLAAETLLRMFNGLPEFRFEAAFSTWVYTIARNCGRRSREREWRRSRHEISFDAWDETERSLLEILGAADTKSPETTLLAKERLRLVQQELDRLPTQMRQCIELRLRKHRKYREIAQSMQLSLGTVKSHLHHARCRLSAAAEAAEPASRRPPDTTN